jgi:hypothetical protein
MEKRAKDAYKCIAIKLRTKPDKRFAHYFVKRIPGNLRKSSSQPAESNHASIVARVSAGSNQDIVQHVKALFDRQLELINLHQQDDAKYQKLSRLKAHEMKDNPSEAEAIETLSNFGYKEYWLLVVEASKEYSHLVLPSGASRLHRNGTRDDSARIIEPGKRCECDHYLQFESMCEHELAKHEGKFIKSLFSERLFSPVRLRNANKL